MKNPILVFPDPQASFLFYLRRERALRKHSARTSQKIRSRIIPFTYETAATANNDAVAIDPMETPNSRN